MPEDALCPPLKGGKPIYPIFPYRTEMATALNGGDRIHPLPDLTLTLSQTRSVPGFRTPWPESGDRELLAPRPQYVQLLSWYSAPGGFSKRGIFQ